MSEVTTDGYDARKKEVKNGSVGTLSTRRSPQDK